MVRTRKNRLTNTLKSTKEDKIALALKIQEAASIYPYIYIFTVKNMRNQYLKGFREKYLDSKIFFGKNRVLAKALGASLSESTVENSFKLGKYLIGRDIGLLMTEKEPETFIKYCTSTGSLDYMRTGSVVDETIAIPEGVVMRNDEPLSHTLESQLRDAGMPVLLKKGSLTLDAPFEICHEGDVLTSNQAKLLKIFFYQLAEFKLVPIASLYKGNIQEYNTAENVMDI